MTRVAEPSAAGSFPRRESFVDCCGNTRDFIIDFSRSDDERFLRAVEVTDAEGHYEFGAMSESSPFLALGRLRAIIRRELSTRYLDTSDGRLGLLHDTLKGRVEVGGLAVDGQFVSFTDLLELLQIYEGFQISLRISDPFDSDT